MSAPTRDAIESFKNITGASESVALRKLEEYGGNLNAAVGAHFLELERSIANTISAPASSQYNPVDTNNQSGFGTRGILPLISAVRRFRPSLLLDPNYRRNLLSPTGAPNSNHHAMSPYTGEVIGVPVGFNSGNDHPLHSGERPAVMDSPGTPSYYRGGVYGNVSRDDHQQIDDVESEMMQAAIEASKQEFEQTYMNERHGSSHGSSSAGLQHQQEDDELTRVLLLSLETADEEKAIRMSHEQYERTGLYHSNEGTKVTTNNSSKKHAEFKAGNSSLRQLPVTHESIHDTHKHLQSKDSLNSNELVGISQKELDEAIMLETQLFSQISVGSSSLPSHEQGGPGRSINPDVQAVSRPQSSSLMDQRSLRQQQDEEYLISLLADKEKEMNALKKAENHTLKEEESLRRKLEGEEIDKVLAEKTTSLPPEPAIDDENVITILVKMPDGTRHGRRFRKSDKLQLLYDFLDVGKVVKPSTYRLVRPYPHRAFDAADRSLSFNQLGLTGKQEALFLEFI